MKTFCPTCGAENDGMPGGRVTCRSCTASFEVPAEHLAPPPVSAPPSTGGWVGPSTVGQPLATSGAPAAVKPGVNPLAIVSLVSGIVCCIPFSSIAAIATGAIAFKQIESSAGAQSGKGLAIAGLVLGSLGALLQLLVLIDQFVK